MKAFSVGNGCKTDDIIQWAEKLISMGEALTHLSAAETDFWFAGYGQHIGGIISQYAQAIKDTVDEAYSDIRAEIDKDSDEKMKQRLKAV